MISCTVLYCTLRNSYSYSYIYRHELNSFLFPELTLHTYIPIQINCTLACNATLLLLYLYSSLLYSTLRVYIDRLLIRHVFVCTYICIYEQHTPSIFLAYLTFFFFFLRSHIIYTCPHYSTLIYMYPSAIHFLSSPSLESV